MSLFRDSRFIGQNSETEFKIFCENPHRGENSPAESSSSSSPARPSSSCGKTCPPPASRPQAASSRLQQVTHPQTRQPSDHRREERLTRHASALGERSPFVRELTFSCREDVHRRESSRGSFEGRTATIHSLEKEKEKEKSARLFGMSGEETLNAAVSTS
jgi:hypothetical protein